MTKQAALNAFFSVFMPAYPENNVPNAKELTFPYMTYENTVGNVGDSVSIIVNLWFKTTSERIPNKMVEDISNVISLGGCIVKYDGGAMWIKRGSPWSNALEDVENTNIKRRILNIEIEFM